MRNMSLDPENSGNRRSRSNEGDGYNEEGNMRPPRRRLYRQHAYTAEEIRSIADENGVDPDLLRGMSLGQILTLSGGNPESRRQIIDAATQRFQNRIMNNGVPNNMPLLRERPPYRNIYPPGRSHSYTTDMIEEIASMHGVNPEIVAVMSLAEIDALRRGPENIRREVIQEATQRYNEEDPDQAQPIHDQEVRQRNNGENPVQAQPIHQNMIIPHGRYFYPFEANGRSNSNIQDCCGICREDIDPILRSHVTASCGHRFHAECLDRWGHIEFLRNQPVRCPICRSTNVQNLRRLPEVMNGNFLS